MVKKDYYDVLGVKKTDSIDNIKKSYKKLALKYHPDKADEHKKKEYEDKFKEINEAYSTLSDENKRKAYDRGETSAGGGFRASGSSGFSGDFSDILKDIFSGGNFQGGFSDYEDSKTGEDLSYELTLEFNEAAFGCEKEILIRKDVTCKECRGSGAKDNKFKTCTECEGQGRVIMQQRTPFGIINRTVFCEECEGTGKIPEHSCSGCRGEGVINSKERIKVKIPKGIDNEQTLKVAGSGNAIKNGSEGDLYLNIRVNPHKIFNREGHNIYMPLNISFSDAALGAEVKIPTLSGTEIKIKIEKGTESESILRIKGEGIPLLNNPNHRGDLFINIKIKTPKKLSKREIELFEELLKIQGQM